MIRTVAFYSYRHIDETASRGLVTSIQKVLQNRLLLSLGEDSNIFLDNDDIKAGDDWPERLEQALDQANYLIPVISVNFFKSDHCRRELERFFEKEEELGRNDLVLPIYLFRFDEYREDAADELIARTARHQHVDWTDFSTLKKVDQALTNKIAAFAGELVAKVKADDAGEAAEAEAARAAEAEAETATDAKTGTVTETPPDAPERDAQDDTAVTGDTKPAQPDPPGEAQPDLPRETPPPPPPPSRTKWVVLAGVMAAIAAIGATKFIPPKPQEVPPEGVAIGTFRDCPKSKGCPEMILLSGGTFMMGSDGEGSFSRERPVKPRVVPKFAMSSTEFSLGSWDFCVSDGVCQPENDKEYYHDDCLEPDCPVVNLTWQDAVDATTWLNTKVPGNDPYRLPSEAEWEFAARAGTTTYFSFGDVIRHDLANYRSTISFNDSPKEPSRNHPLKVDALPPNPWGLYHVHGNVYEWVADCASDGYEDANEDGRAGLADLERINCPKGERIQRSGSWSNGPRYLRSAMRLRSPAKTGGGDDKRGFRPARDVPDIDLINLQKRSETRAE